MWAMARKWGTRVDSGWFCWCRRSLLWRCAFCDCGHFGTSAGGTVLDVIFENSTRSCVGQLSGLTSGMRCGGAVRDESGSGHDRSEDFGSFRWHRGRRARPQCQGQRQLACPPSRRANEHKMCAAFSHGQKTEKRGRGRCQAKKP